MADKKEEAPKITPKKYINPLTLAARNFLHALLTEDNHQIDPVLYEVILKIIKAMQNFTDHELIKITPTPELQLMSIEEISRINHGYFCSTCTKKFTTAHAACAHLAKQCGIDFSKSKPKKIVLPDLPRKAKSLLSPNLRLAQDQCLSVAENMKWLPQYDIIERDLRAVIHPLFKGKPIKIYRFGSRISGTALSNADLDLFIDIDNQFDVFENPALPPTVMKLRRVCYGIKADKDHWSKTISVEGASVPIIQTHHIATKIDCDIGFSNSLAYCNTQLVAYLWKLQPIARRMCLFLKQFIRSIHFDDINSYSITCMVIFYMQIHGHLPPIDDLQAEDSTATYVGPWKSHFVELPLEFFGMTTLVDDFPNWFSMQKSFFDYYANFDYANFVICPLFGRLVGTQKFDVEMPERYKLFISNNEKGSLDMAPIKVQDPLQLNRNLTRIIGKKKLRCLTNFFMVFEQLMNEWQAKDNKNIKSTVK